MSTVEVKQLDEQGRLIIPKRWRKKVLRGGKVLLRLKGDSIEIAPWERVDLTKFFDSVQVDVKSDLADWHAVRKELRRSQDEIHRQ